jgi:hypothetical protein
MPAGSGPCINNGETVRGASCSTPACAPGVQAEVNPLTLFTANYNTRPSGAGGTTNKIGVQFVASIEAAAAMCLETPNCIGFWGDGRYPINTDQGDFYWTWMYAAGPGTDLATKSQITTYVKK